MQRYSLRALQGFTLIEVIAGIVIIGIALGTIVLMFSTGVKFYKLSHQRLTAYHELQREMEAILGGFFEEVEGHEAKPVWHLDGYQCQVNVTQPDPLLKEVEVIVEWTNFAGRRESESIKTYISKRSR